MNYNANRLELVLTNLPLMLSRLQQLDPGLRGAQAWTSCDRVGGCQKIRSDGPMTLLREGTRSDDGLRLTR